MTESMAGTNRRRTTGQPMGPGPGGRAEDERIAELSARLDRLEGAPGLRQRGRTLMSRVMPAEAGTHFRNAGREQLLGIRSIVDFWIERLDDAERRASDVGRGRETIEIE